MTCPGTYEALRFLRRQAEGRSKIAQERAFRRRVHPVGVRDRHCGFIGLAARFRRGDGPHRIRDRDLAHQHVVVDVGEIDPALAKAPGEAF